MPKLYNDSVHGHIYIPDYCFKFIDTPAFQRLRRIKQLGVASYVFEGATHTRFGHSIGVAYLANKMATIIQKDYPELKVSDKTVELITIAGLLHDIGHGPYSHLFEDVVRKYIPDYSHEEMSCRIIDGFAEYSDDFFDSKEDIEFVKSVIRGRPPNNNNIPFQWWMYEIVSNPTTSIDVDKFDYFQRDTKYANVQITYNPSRFFSSFKIKNGHIVYPQKELYNIYEFYHTRYILFKTIYYHKVVAQIETMVIDILHRMHEEKDINLIESISDFEQFAELTDDIIFRDQYKCSQLYHRDLYKVVWEGVFHPSSCETSHQIITYDNIVKKYPHLKHKIFVVKKKINYTQNYNPMDNVLFYDKDKVYTIKNMNKTMLMSESFEEIIVRVISKHADVRECIEQFMAEHKIQEIEVQYK